MARESGINGTIHSAVTGGTVAELTAEVKNWELNISNVLHVEGSNATGRGKGVTIGGYTWTVTCEIFADTSQAFEFDEDNKYDIELHKDGNDANYYSGTVAIESIDTGCDMDDGATRMFNVTFQGDGELTKTGTL